VRKQISIFLICIYFGGYGACIVCAQAPSDKVEIIINGKQFDSILEYKREQIKIILDRALSSVNLHEFSDEELSEIITEVRKEQTAETLPDKSSEPEGHQVDNGDAVVLSADQMQEMLRLYLKEHKEATPLDFDPDKVKNILIEPNDSSEDLLSD